MGLYWAVNSNILVRAITGMWEQYIVHTVSQFTKLLYQYVLVQAMTGTLIRTGTLNHGYNIY